jgi:hypothetical protein
MQQPTCESCPCYVPDATGRQGACHFGPPTPQVVGAAPPVVTGGPPRLNTLGIWPPVRASDWCWQHPQARALTITPAGPIEPWSSAREPVE